MYLSVFLFGLNTYDAVHTRATFNLIQQAPIIIKLDKEKWSLWQVITQLGTATGTPEDQQKQNTS